MYTFAPRSPERRSAQTAMYAMADGLMRLLAPVLSFTCDEAWQHLPGKRTESVHMTVFPTSDELQRLFIVSQVDLRALPAGSDGHRHVVIERAEGVKCARCWRYVASVSTEPAWEGLCERWQEALRSRRDGQEGRNRQDDANGRNIQPVPPLPPVLP